MSEDFSISFKVVGVPKPAGSKRAFRTKTGKIVVVDTSGEAGEDWRVNVKAEALRVVKNLNMSMPVFQKGPIALHVAFYMPRPKSHYYKKGIRLNAPMYHAVRPDATKLLRAVEDSLTGVLWADDAAIALQLVEKRYANGEPCAQITVKEISG